MKKILLSLALVATIQLSANDEQAPSFNDIQSQNTDFSVSGENDVSVKECGSKDVTPVVRSFADEKEYIKEITTTFDEKTKLTSTAVKKDIVKDGNEYEITLCKPKFKPEVQLLS